jgi:MFS transporter, OPA family, sugar phosphate sensor protein UhpC
LTAPPLLRIVEHACKKPPFSYPWQSDETAPMTSPVPDTAPTSAAAPAVISPVIAEHKSWWRSMAGVFATGADQPVRGTQQEIDRAFRRKRLAVMLSITIGYGIAYTCRLGLSVVKKPMIDAGIFTADQLGIIGSALFYAYAFGKLVNGFLADHANMKVFWPVGVLLSALINIAMGFSAVLWLSVFFWALNGWFQGFGAPAGAVALSQWFSNRERGRYYGIWSTAHSVGEGLTLAGLSLVVAYVGWRGAFFVPGILCVLVAGVLYFSMQDRPRALGLPSVADWKHDHGIPTASGKHGSWHVQLSILKLPSIWILALACATMTMTRYAINSWGILYLQEAKGYSLLQAGGLSALNPLAGLVGCAAYGFISDKLFDARRPPVNLICGLLEIAALLVLFFSPPGHPWLLTAAFLIYGLAINGLITALGGLFGMDIAPKNAAGAVMGFIGVFAYVGAGIQERISGLLISKGTTLVNGVRHYDFSIPIWFWLGTSVLSLILSTSLWRVRASD